MTASYKLYAMLDARECYAEETFGSASPAIASRRTASCRKFLSSSMAYHCYHDQPCPDCGRCYVRYADDVPCPACGSTAALTYALVEELVHYARLTLTAQGTLELSGFAPLSQADAYVIYGYELLEAWRLHPELPPELIAGEAIRSYRLDRHPGEAAHWRGFFAALLSRWHEVRHQPLPQPTLARPASPPPPEPPAVPPAGAPPAPPAAAERHLYLKGRLGAKDL